MNEQPECAVRITTLDLITTSNKNTSQKSSNTTIIIPFVYYSASL